MIQGRGGMLTINVGVLLAVIVLLRLRRRTESRSRNDEKLTVIIVRRHHRLPITRHEPSTC